MSGISFTTSSLFFFFFFLAIPIANFHTLDALSVDIINQTCKKCADKSSLMSYDFCSSALGEVPASHFTNLPGLVIISLELALENLTETISIITSLLSNESFDPFALACLEDCLESYTDGVLTLVDGIAEFLTGHFSDAAVKVNAVVEAAMTCEDGFKDKQGEVSPLTMENYSLLQLSDTALCIIHFLSVAIPRSDYHRPF